MVAKDCEVFGGCCGRGENIGRDSLVSSIRIIFFFLALFPLFASQASSSDGNFSAPVFVIPQGGPATISAAHLEFLEGADETASFEFLEKAEWAPKLVADQSLVEGYWVRLRVQNTLPTDDVGIKHNFNKEKRIFARHSDGVDEYPYWSGSGDSWIDEGRINAHYLVTMPQGEITTIYNFFRSKPFDRYYSKVDGLDRITIGKWSDIRLLEFFRLATNLAVVAIASAFGLYYLFMFVVGRGSYLWLSASLFQISVHCCLYLSLSSVIQPPLWLANVEMDMASTSLLFVFLLQFFRGSLDLRRNFPVLNRVFLAGIAFYLLMVVLNAGSSLTYPSAPYLDLVAHPPDRAGPGIVKLSYLIPPFLLLLLGSAILSFVLWRRGSNYAKFLMISFALPFLAVPITAATYLVFGFSWQGWMVISAVVGFLMLAMFITFGFAVAQQLNDMKNLALTQQIRLTQAYQRFVPPQLLQNLGRASILDVKLGDQVDVEMSILFSDIRSFTAISEAMSPSENFAFVNAYLSRMGPIIRARRGYIDKFMGDGVMALFPESANDAVLAAVEMQKELHRYNDEQDCAGAPRINVGVGVNTGRMMLGTLGESDRMEGSVISDAVNLASRLEGLTKRYGSKVIISEHTYRLLDTTKLDCREIDSVVVKGKDRPVRIFEVIDGEPPEIAGLKLDSLAQFCEAMSLYKTQQFAKARGLFKAILSHGGSDNVAALYVERCETLLEDGWNPETWDGVEKLETK